AGHADRVVEAQGRVVLGPDEETHGRDLLEQPAAEVAQRTAREATPAGLRVDPHLLQLHRRGGPRRRLRLEADHAVLGPEPGAPFLDLLPRAPAETVGVALERVDSDLFTVRRGTGGHEHLEIRQAR